MESVNIDVDEVYRDRAGKGNIHQTTKDEITYLRGLGGWKDPGNNIDCPGNRITKNHNLILRVDPIRRRRLLELYKRNIPLRKDWDMIEVGKVLEFINEELKVLTPI